MKGALKSNLSKCYVLVLEFREFFLWLKYELHILFFFKAVSNQSSWTVMLIV